MIDNKRLRELRDEIGADDLAEVAEMFLSETEDVVFRITNAATITAEDMHFLKGSALNLGLTDLGQYCALAEAKLQNDGQVQPDLAEINALFDSGRRSLRAALLAV